MKRQRLLIISLIMIVLIGPAALVQPVAPASAGDGGGSAQGGGGGGGALSLPGDTFVPETSSTVFRTDTTGGVALLASTSSYMHAPVNLPDGARITSFVFYYYDNHDPGRMSASLVRNNYPNAGSRTYLASASSPSGVVAGSHYSYSSSTLPTPEVVDNGRYNYEIEVYWSAASTEANGLRLMGVKVVYSD
jgi:hypothetical protein